MYGLKIALKDGNYIDIDGLSTINGIGSDNKAVSFEPGQVADMPLRDGITYVFVGQKLTASLCGAEIKYLLFSTDN